MHFLAELAFGLMVGFVVMPFVIRVLDRRPIAEKRTHKSRAVAVLLAVLLWGTGAHKLYIGQRRGAAIMFCVTFGGSALAGAVVGLLTALEVVPIPGWLPTVATCAPVIAMCAVSCIEAILYIVQSDATFDAKYVVGNRQWF